MIFGTSLGTLILLAIIVLFIIAAVNPNAFGGRVSFLGGLNTVARAMITLVVILFCCWAILWLLRHANVHISL